MPNIELWSLRPKVHDLPFKRRTQVGQVMRWGVCSGTARMDLPTGSLWPNSGTSSHDQISDLLAQSMFLRNIVRLAHRVTTQGTRAPYVATRRCYRVTQQLQFSLSTCSMSSVTTHPSLKTVSTERQHVPRALNCNVKQFDYVQFHQLRLGRTARPS